MNKNLINDERYAYVNELLENKFIEFKTNNKKVPDDFKSVFACISELHELKSDNFTMLKLLEISMLFYKHEEDKVSDLVRFTKVIEFLGFEIESFEWELIMSLYHEEEARIEELRNKVWKEMIDELWNL